MTIIMESKKEFLLSRLRIEHLVLSAMLCIISTVVILNCNNNNDLKSNGKLVSVKIIEYLPPGKAMNFANYKCSFLFNNNSKELISQSRIQSNRIAYVGQYFPAMYSEKTDAIRVLMTSEDFEEFNIPYPDSLLNRVFPVSD
jgi:translation elongation factor P/translation initiation factor 5A